LTRRAPRELGGLMRGETIHRRNVRPSLTDPSVPNDQHKPAASVAEGRLDVQMTVTPLGEGALLYCVRRGSCNRPARRDELSSRLRREQMRTF
jgi:hypothetical protein